MTDHAMKPQPTQPTPPTPPDAPARSGTQDGAQPGASVRLPAEWEPLSRVWVRRPAGCISWPTDASLTRAQAQHDAYVAALSEVVEVCDIGHDNRNDVGHNNSDATRTQSPAPASRRVDLGIDVADAWLRDTGPIFTHATAADGSTRWIANDFRYNAYGGKWDEMLRDDAVAGALGRALGLTTRREDRIVLEGGAIETDGRGTLLITEPCFIDQRRNPGMTLEQVNAVLRDTLGVDRVLCLPTTVQTGILGDHTDGHIDNVARFVAPDRLLAVRGVEDAVLDWLRANLPHCEVVPLPLPGPLPQGVGGALRFEYPGSMPEAGDQPLAASYANFLIANGSVFVPVFNQPTDDPALAIIDDATPGLRIVPIHADALIVGGGTLHCLTMHQPA